MRIYSVLTILCFSAPGCYAAAQGASDPLDADKRFAVAQVSAALRDRCLADFSRRMEQPVSVRPDGRLQFNEPVSREVYKTFYWKGSDRGVAFTLPVKVPDPKYGEMSANVLCFYAIAGDGLRFQLSQQWLRRLASSGP